MKHHSHARLFLMSGKSRAVLHSVKARRVRKTVGLSQKNLDQKSLDQKSLDQKSLDQRSLYQRSLYQRSLKQNQKKSVKVS